MRKIMTIAAMVALSLGLSACWGSDTASDPRIGQVVAYVKSQCGWVVEAASIAAMLAAPNPAVAPTVKTLGNAICVALNDTAPAPQVQTFLGWGQDKPCPRVNGVCIEAKRDEPGK